MFQKINPYNFDLIWSYFVDFTKLKWTKSKYSSISFRNNRRYWISIKKYLGTLLSSYFANISADEFLKYFFRRAKIKFRTILFGPLFDYFRPENFLEVSLHVFQIWLNIVEKKQYFSTSCFRTLVKNRNSLKISKLFKLFGLGFRFRIK